MEPISNFSERFNELLFDRKLTPEEFAAAIGVSRTTVYRWKLASDRIFLSNLAACADFFHCTIEFLIGRSGDNRTVEPNPRPKFSLRLRAVMKERGITTYSIRKISRYDGMYFRTWDLGADPVLPTLIELSSILDCTIDYLIGRDE
ncbi:MAG: helix-turn-helix transcriptional regulator [Clostridiales bacterium]|jgi:transcriptional regulator with XRE-family HTH domain|nr:helix-turn-helix transcriptional regulator [Clostridiales bacterium]